MKKLVLFVLAVTLAWSSTYGSTRTLPASGKAAEPTAKAMKPATPALQVIDVGPSAVLLKRGWRFHPGDSPWANGAPLWAQPGYDDSGWAPMNMVSKAGTVDPIFGTPDHVPGWTGRGYPHLSGYAWYRLRVRVANPDQPLRLKMPGMFTNAFELYANGQYVGQYGNPSKRHFLLSSQPVSFALPRPGSDGIVTLALRFYVSPSTLVSERYGGSHVGGMQGPIAVGLASTVKLMQASEAGFHLRNLFSSFVVILLGLLTTPLALWAWLYDRKARLWLWLFLLLAAELVVTLDVVVSTSPAGPSAGIFYAIFSLSVPAWYATFILFWWHWFRLEEKRWIAHATWVLSGVMMTAFFLQNSPAMGIHFLPSSALPWCASLAVGFQVGCFMLEIVVFVEGFRKDRIAALLPVLALLAAIFNKLQEYLGAALHIPPVFYLFGLGIQPVNVIEFLTIVIIFALSLRRFMQTQVRESREREAMHRDMEDAQELQQLVLVPEAVDSRNFTVEAEYHPAQKVGGDFFQTVTRPDGTLLVVIGDVSGKGVSAAMLVAVLVGTIRNQVEHSFDPQEMLAVLNRRMMGRSGGHFATCLAAEIAPDGTMRIANAGHLQPYLNGAEMELDGALPLGLTPDAEYAVQTVKLNSGDRLTLVTDGVVEAQNEAKELFGFERTREVSRELAATIAERAQSFGQEDDITVVGVAFAAA